MFYFCNRRCIVCKIQSIQHTSAILFLSLYNHALYICIIMNNKKPPLYFRLLLLFMLLPLLGYPFCWQSLRGIEYPAINANILDVLIYLLPLYVLLSQYMSFKAYNDNKTVAWILQALLFLVYAICSWLVWQVA